MTRQTTEPSDHTRRETRLDRWRTRLQAWGLDGLAIALLEAAEPLSPLGAQALYVAQPTLRLFASDDQVTRWARLLEDPATVARVRDRLAAVDDDSTFPDDKEGSPDDPGN
jgi:hypothetical protein